MHIDVVAHVPMTGLIKNSKVSKTQEFGGR